MCNDDGGHDGLDWDDIALIGAISEKLAEEEKERERHRREMEDEQDKDEGKDEDQLKEPKLKTFSWKCSNSLS